MEKPPTTGGFFNFSGFGMPGKYATLRSSFKLVFRQGNLVLGRGKIAQEEMLCLPAYGSRALFLLPC